MTAVPFQPGPPVAGDEHGYAGPERRRQPSSDVATARLTALSRAAGRIVAARSVGDLAAVAVRAGVEAVGAGGGTVAVRENRRGVVRLSSTEDYNPALVGRWPEFPLDAPVPIAHVARTGERLLLPDRAAALARFPGAVVHQRLTDEGGSRIVAAAVLPLQVPGRLLGSLALTWPQEQTFSVHDVELLDALAVMVAQALDRLVHLTERDRALGWERLLARSSELLRAGLDRDAVLETVLDIVRPALGEAAWVRLPDGAVRGDPPPAPGGAGSTVEAPLVANGSLLGTLGCARSEGPDHLPEETALLRDVADRAALALAHTLLFAEQRDTSVALQQALLTAPPAPTDLQVVVRYQPATRAAVGGDWYDAFVTRDGSTVLVIGDVVGHDIEAAASMGQLRALVRTVAYLEDGSPAAVLVDAERAALGLSVSTMASVLLARVEVRVRDTSGQAGGTGRALRWTNAGHLPPLLLCADGRVEVLTSEPDVLLGVDPDLPRHDHEHPLVDGDTVLLFTDGLVERRGQDLDEGLGELRGHLAGLVGLGVDELCDVLLARMLPYGAEDDVALVALRWSAKDRPSSPDGDCGRLPPG